VRLLVDAMRAEFCGIRTHVDHLLGRWADFFPAGLIADAVRTARSR
jgi:hypothetical protein